MKNWVENVTEKDVAVVWEEIKNNLAICTIALGVHYIKQHATSIGEDDILNSLIVETINEGKHYECYLREEGDTP
jgi:hypothetical protein